MIGWHDTGRTALRYDLTGEGETLVLVHEMGGTLESWDFVLPDLAPGRRILRYDTRGAGQSEKARGILTLSEMTTDLADLLDGLTIPGKITLAGCAVGAAIVLQFALDHPDRCAALVVMAPATGIPPDRQAATLARADAVEQAGMRAIVEESFANSYPPELRQDAARFATFRARWLAGDPASYAAIYRMLAASSLSAGLPDIACPTLVIAGTLDRLRPPSSVRPVAQAIPDARFLQLETGHFMATQTPAQVAVAINAFFAETRRINAKAAPAQPG